MPMTARNVTQSDVAEAAGASGSFRSPCGSPTISRPSSTRRSPSAHDPRLAPSRARAGSPTWTAPPASPPRALPRTSWLPRAASSPEVPPGRHDRGADAMRTVPRDGGPGSRRFWRPPHKQMSHDRSRGTPGRTVGQVVGNDPAPSSDI